MIIWINGTFGSGKSAIAELSHLKIEISHIYDPEQVGYFLWDSFPDGIKRTGYFQDNSIYKT